MVATILVLRSMTPNLAAIGRVLFPHGRAWARLVNKGPYLRAFRVNLGVQERLSIGAPRTQDVRTGGADRSDEHAVAHDRRTVGAEQPAAAQVADHVPVDR
jgi:hypothetical protein